MTSAHRPTWNAAVASGTNPSGTAFVAQTTKVANRDAASFLSLKVRQAGQGLVEERGSKKALREDLEKREQKAREERLGIAGSKASAAKAPAKAIEDNPFPEDADEDVPEPSEASDKEDSDDDEEDTEELMRELAKIKKEREAEEEAQKAAVDKVDSRAKRDEIMKGNPLLMADTDLSLKRKWDDDTVFKNQARTAPKQKQRFINDSVRSDFHKRFLNKYVWIDGLPH